MKQQQRMLTNNLSIEFNELKELFNNENNDKTNGDYKQFLQLLNKPHIKVSNFRFHFLLV